MASQVETLLRIALADGATFAQKQLLKSDNFGQAIVQILKARRRRARLQGLLFMLPCGLLPIAQLLCIGLGTRFDPIDFAGFWPIGFLVLMQLPSYIERRANLTRLETLVALWFLTEDDENKESIEPNAALLELFPLTEG